MQPTATTACGPTLALEVGGLEQRVDTVLLGLLDEPAGVDQHGVGGGRVVDQPEPVGGQPARELLGVDVVASAAQRHHGDRQLLTHPSQCAYRVEVSANSERGLESQPRVPISERSSERELGAHRRVHAGWEGALAAVSKPRSPRWD